MAEYLTRKMVEEMEFGGSIEVRSAGILASSGGRIPQKTIQTLRGVGIDIKDHKTTPIDKKMVEEATLILAMDNTHKEELLNRFPFIREKVFLFKEFAGLGKDGILDPMGSSFEAYETCLAHIRKALPRIMNRIERGDLYGQ